MATKTENLSDPASCLNRAAADEPLFVLRAHDKLAPGVVRVWAEARRFSRGPDDEAAADAEDIAEAMEHWRDING